MKAIRSRNHEIAAYILEDVKSLDVGSFETGFTMHDVGGHEFPAPCTMCPGRHCHALSDSLGRAIEICPTSSIARDPSTNLMVIANTCFGCGLCALACPTGSIRVVKSVAKLISAPEGVISSPVAASRWEEWFGDIFVGAPAHPYSASQVSGFANDFANNCSELKGREFYKVVEGLFRLLGLAARMSNLGDTSNRIDLIIETTEGSVPVEIKSYTETPTINMKGIQQALENKVLVTRRDGVSEMTKLSTLVVGFDYPTDRTRSSELVEDIFVAFGISVGMISLGRLYEAVINLRLNEIEIDHSRFLKMRGIL